MLGTKVSLTFSTFTSSHSQKSWRTADRLLCPAMSICAGLEIVAEMMEAYEAALESPNGPPLSRPISELATHCDVSPSVRPIGPPAASATDAPLPELSTEELFQRMVNAEV
jgi:hypothetical protein